MPFSLPLPYSLFLLYSLFLSYFQKPLPYFPLPDPVFPLSPFLPFHRYRAVTIILSSSMPLEELRNLLDSELSGTSWLVLETSTTQSSSIHTPYKTCSSSQSHACTPQPDSCTTYCPSLCVPGLLRQAPWVHSLCRRGNQTVTKYPLQIPIPVCLQRNLNNLGSTLVDRLPTFAARGLLMSPILCRPKLLQK